MERKTKKPKPPTESEYERAAVSLALSYAPRVRQCMKCGWPTLDGYCCNYCGDTNPSSEHD